MLSKYYKNSGILFYFKKVIFDYNNRKKFIPYLIFIYK